ncbi:MAG: tRNA(Ile)(2)-agmatinylcytidine synthase [Candidatus Thermoplasmatota archaeon]|nr:tRNA(Ile)(2)-agmatinylcytidine synthase [Candidatus Thermoplasmatota archaeon]
MIKRLSEKGFDIIDFPRLVRLNPNIPWKTRGNGAICFKVGKRKGKKIKIGEINNKDIFCYSNFSEIENTSEIAKVVKDTINEFSWFEDDNTNSGFVLLKKQPNYKLYDKAVKDILSIDEIKSFLKDKKAVFKGYKNCRGLIGATCSIAWNPTKDRTYELIAYRKKDKWGSKRFVDDKSVKIMNESFPSTFDNFDYSNNHNRLVPSSPCPILFGIRGEKIDDLVDAKKMVISGEIDSWIIFESNQGTDEHLQRKKIVEVKSFESVILEGIVYGQPVTIKGGHVIFEIKDETGKIDCAAYEPTKEFRHIVRELIVGDMLVVYGGVREKPLTVNLEKIFVKNLEEKFVKVENPVCPKFGKHMKSKGENQGFKCVRCRTISDVPIIKKQDRMIKTGFYEVPICARRHLSKPLKRIYK